MLTTLRHTIRIPTRWPLYSHVTILFNSITCVCFHLESNHYSVKHLIKATLLSPEIQSETKSLIKEYSVDLSPFAGKAVSMTVNGK